VLARCLRGGAAVSRNRGEGRAGACGGRCHRGARGDRGPVSGTRARSSLRRVASVAARDRGAPSHLRRHGSGISRLPFPTSGTVLACGTVLSSGGAPKQLRSVTPSRAERWSAPDPSIPPSIEETGDDPAGAGVQVEDEGPRRAAAVGVPVPARRSRLGAAAGGRVRVAGGGGEGAAEGARPARPGRGTSDDHARRVRGRVPGDASGGTGHDREAALASEQIDRGAR